MKTDEEILEMIDMLNNDIDRYQILHEKGLGNIKCKENFPRYKGEFKDAILIFKAQRQILQWVLGADFG